MSKNIIEGISQAIAESYSGEDETLWLTLFHIRLDIFMKEIDL